MKRSTYFILQRATDGLKNGVTITDYKRIVKGVFDPWATSQGIEQVKDLSDAVGVAQAFEKHLETKGYSAATIHTYLAPICRGLGVDMSKIDKPRRSAADITKGRTLSDRSEKVAQDAKYARSVRLAQICGVRRSELMQITPRSICKDESGEWCVQVKGKGGKVQLQRILPEDQQFLRELARDKDLGDKLLSRDEFSNNANYHYYRAQGAQKAYSYYIDRLNADPEYRSVLETQLIDRFIEEHVSMKRNTSTAQKQLSDFLHELRDTPYVLRGSNRAVAIEAGKPVVYDRLAVMAVSVFHLSHWRADVTVVNYLNK